MLYNYFSLSHIELHKFLFMKKRKWKMSFPLSDNLCHLKVLYEFVTPRFALKSF